jgi:hypothetical protein
MNDDRHEVGPAAFSPDRRYRYMLSREWDKSAPRLMVVGLNPSTADEYALDPTLRRVREFAKRWGMGGFVMTNLFGFRATKPRDMIAADDPVGPMNDHWLEHLAKDAGLVLAAWGAHGGFLNRDKHVLELLTAVRGSPPVCLGTTAKGFPRHPLYIKGDTQPIPYLGRVL